MIMRNRFSVGMNIQYYEKDASMLLKIIRKTAQDEISWVHFGALLEYLKGENISIKSIPVIYNYMVYQRQRRNILNLNSRSYLCCFDGNLIVLAQDSYSSKLWLDIIELSDCANKWMAVRATPVSLVRLRDMIYLAGASDSAVDCQEFLYSIRGISV